MRLYELDLAPADAKYGRVLVWQWPVRVTHWVTAASIVALFTTGMFICYPFVTSSGEPTDNFLMGRVRQVHFAAGYALMISLLTRFFWFFAGNNYARSGVPLFWRKAWWGSIWSTIKHYGFVERGGVALGHNSLAGMAYTLGVGGVGLAMVGTGFALYGETNPGGFWDTLFGWMIPLLGGSFRVRIWHHTMAWGFVIFVLVHLYFVTFDSFRYDNGLFSAMINGNKFYQKGDKATNDWVS